MAAVGHGGLIRDIKKQKSLRASTLEALCRELGLEFYVGPQRHPVPPEIALELSLEEDCGIPRAVTEIQELKRRDSAILDFVKQVEKQLQDYQSETARHVIEVLREQTEANPDHLRNAPLHAVPFVTHVRAAGSQAVELSLAPIGLSFKRADIAAAAEWPHLVSLVSPGGGDLIAVDMMKEAEPKSGALLLDVSDRKFVQFVTHDCLTLGSEGLDVRHIGWGGDNWAYSEPVPAGRGSSQRRRLSPGEWIVGRIAGTASSEPLSPDTTRCSMSP